MKKQKLPLVQCVTCHAKPVDFWTWALHVCVLRAERRLS